MQQKHPGLPPWHHHLLPKQLTFRANDWNKAVLLPFGEFTIFSTRKLVLLVKKEKEINEHLFSWRPDFFLISRFCQNNAKIVENNTHLIKVTNKRGRLSFTLVKLGHLHKT